MTTYLGTATGSTPGVRGDSSVSANGVKGTSSTGWSATYGECSGQGAGAHGYSTNTTMGYGVYGRSDAASGYGVYAINNAAGFAVFGVSSAGHGVVGHGDSGYGVTGYGLYGVYGYTTSSNGYGVYGSDNAKAGALAGYFSGSVQITADLTVSGTKSFLIDHPLDPANRYLQHACVESPERKNVYDGVGVADADGVLLVELPPYFEALNGDVRYQLTAIGAPAPSLHVRDELSGGRFAVAGAGPGQRISWQVTGVRKDAHAAANPLVVERDKPAHERGLYLDPAAHGAPIEEGIGHGERARLAARLDAAATARAPDGAP